MKELKECNSNSGGPDGRGQERSKNARTEEPSFAPIDADDGVSGSHLFGTAP